MVIELIVSILVVSVTTLALCAHDHWKKLQRHDKELKRIGKMLVVIVEEVKTESRERSRFDPCDQV
jgi:hypothetical protein